MSYFVRSGNTFNVTDKNSIDLYDSLPAGNYSVQLNSMSQSYYLEMIDEFTSPAKIYGDISKNVERIFKTFIDREHSTGILLSGEKGSGKTLLAKELSILCNKNDIPTIIINSAFEGDTFNKFVQDIDQPAIFLFDEFEKVYDKKGQGAILTLLDGVYPSKKLFILTANDIYSITNNMKNRPGRLYYMIEFDNLEITFIEEYCNENLKNKEHHDAILKVVTVFSRFNFDMLQALVEEVNRYNETPQKALELLNIKPQNESNNIYDVSVIVDNIEYEKGKLVDPVYHSHPLLEPEFTIDVKNDKSSEWLELFFHQSDLKNIEGDGGTFIFVNSDNETLKIKRRDFKKINFLNF